MKEYYHYDNQEFTVHTPATGKQRIPRYYREKIFTKDEITQNSEQLQQSVEAAETREFARVASFGNNPYSYRQDVAENYKKALRKRSKNSQQL